MRFIKGTGLKTSHMAMEYKGFQMDQFTKVISRTDQKKDKVDLLNVGKKFMMDNGWTISPTERVNRHSKMELCISVNFSMVSKMVLEFVNGWINPITEGNGRTTSMMEMESTIGKMVGVILVSGERA